MLAIILAAFVATAWAADTPCINAGGHCQTDSLACSGGYQSGLCSGASNRRCCMPTTTHSGSIEPALLGAVASRETQGGALLDSRGYGDNGNGYGIMQCDIHHSGLDCTRCGPRSCCHLEMMSAFLITKIKLVESRHTSGVAAYNYFPSSSSFSAVDSHTTGHDYSNDVIARAQWLKNHYGWV
ncbi:hypothetical protein BaRGS_00035957 [Batillaria attramentaria]|uniref:Lysozyme n=1 Tax=Batillaria attramentaria TaxID=370345 RepID=A0ABD0JD20_9CAEN